MSRKYLLLSIILLNFYRASSKKIDNKQEWAVIVAGSNGWGNYRHQADACHAYHVLRNHGVPEENIILMMYDDVANNPMNPMPGKLINRPNGTDVYAGCKIDYRKADVTPANFLKVIQGKSMSGIGTERTVNSGPNDHLFVYFTDHGATGLIAFPSDMLYAQDLNKALKIMHQKKRYARLVFYLEACESGSMFENILPKDINVYAMTAANSHESSWGCYCDVTKPRLPCLGDLFSVVWMQDSDVEDLHKESLGQQFKIVKKGTDKSHVMEYGDLSWQDESVSDYQGESPTSHLETAHRITGLVDAREIPMFQLEKEFLYAESEAQRREIHRKIKHLQEGRRYIDALFDAVLDDLIFDEADRDWVQYNRDGVGQDLRCHKIVTEAFNQRCISLTTHTYGLRHVYKLSNLCRLPDVDLATVVTTMIDTCERYNLQRFRPNIKIE